MLTIVKLALRHHQANAALEQSTRAISNFLGPSAFLSLSDACKFGSIALLEWIWKTSCTRAVDRTPGWSLTNFLRSDPHYHNWQFAKSLEAAANRGDLRMMEWIFAHFSGCEAPEAVAERAGENGYLRVLNCLMAHRSPPRGQSGDPFVQGEGTVRISRTTNFLTAAAIKKATENGQLVEYLSAELPLENYARGIAIKHALRLGGFHLAEQLLPSGGCLLDYAAGCPRVEMIEWMLDCGYLRRDEELAASTLPELARTGRLDIAQQVLLLHSPLRHESKNWSTLWFRALYEAGTCGHISVLQWLVEHPKGREALDRLSKGTSTRDWFCVAAKRGHVETMDYLYKQGIACSFYDAMVVAVERGQVSSVKWLLSNHSYESIKRIRAIDRSAEYGHLEILKMFNELNSYECTEAKRRRVSQSDSWWSVVVDPMYFAAKGGHLEVLKWFQANRMQKCDTDTMDIAATYGHLEVMKWLHLNRSEGCTSEAMNGAAAHGHLEVVQWLYANYSDRCTRRAMYDAAEFGHLQIVKWLYEYCPMSHSRRAVDRAIRSGHLRVASWLQQRFPEYRVGDELECHKELVTVDGSWDSANALEVLLWLHSRDNYVLPSWFLQALRYRLSERWKKPDLMVHITHWMDEHYPDSP